ncbi:MAG: CAP domain-containing protein [Bacteroidota bacterium]
MRKLVFIIAAIFLCSAVQTGPYAKWDAKEIEKANSGKNISYLGDEEKRVITLCNMARVNPKLFAETIVEHYIDSVSYKGSAYLNSLKKTLLTTKPMSALAVAEDMYAIAKDHAEQMGKTGKKGHENFEKRYAAAKKKYSGLGENCHYGSNKAMKIVMALLIDEGVGDSGHRKNILDPNFKYIGVALREHKSSTWNCVMSFSGPEKEK